MLWEAWFRQLVVGVLTVAVNAIPVVVSDQVIETHSPALDITVGSSDL